MQETAIHTALDATSIFMQNEDERLAYLNREMAIMDYESDKESWTEEGRKEGRKEGVMDMVKSMIANGLDDKTIERISSWPVQEIEKIRKQS